MNPASYLDRLSAFLFWDTDRAAVDVNRHGAFIITRVMDRGSSEDVRATWAFYGPDRIREALVAAPALDKKTISFFANQFDLPCEAFRAYRNQGANWSS